MTTRSVLAFAVSAASAVFVTGAGASENAASWCEQQWFVVSAQYVDQEVPDYAGLLQRWQQYGPKCQGTVAYEARLAFIYFYLDQPAKATEALQAVEAKVSEYRYLLELAQLLTEFKRLMLSKQMDEPHLRGFEHRLADFVKRNPHLFEGYALLGAIEVILNRHEEAITLLEKAAAMEGSPGSRAGIYRNLTISYAEVGRYQEAYDAGGEAISLSKAFFGDPYFMYAVAKTDAGLGRFADAQTAIRVIAKKRPQVKDTKDFLSTVDFIFDKMKENKDKP